MKRTAPLLATTLASLALLTACGQPDDASSAAGAPADAAEDALVGEWTMTALEPGGDVDGSVPFDGQVIFTDAGTMAVQAANPDAAAPNTAYTVAGYEAFYGPVDVDTDAGIFVVTVEHAAARDLVGQELSRAYEVTDDTLVLTPTDPAETWRVTYEREQS